MNLDAIYISHRELNDGHYLMSIISQNYVKYKSSDLTHIDRK